MEEKKKKHRIQIEFDENTGQGHYANFAMVTHSQAEFILDFIRLLPGMTKAKAKSRIIMAPVHVKTLLMMLQDNINKFEDKFGEIKVAKQTGLPEIKLKTPDDLLPN